MADLVTNVAKGRAVELHNRVVNNDPATSGLMLTVLRASGLAGDTVLLDCLTLAQVLSISPEVTNSGYNRITLTDTDLTGFGFVTDNVNNWNIVDTPNVTWPAVLAGDLWAKLIFNYVPIVGTSTDAQITPMTIHDFPWTPNGGFITANVNNYMRAIGLPGL